MAPPPGAGGAEAVELHPERLVEAHLRFGRTPASAAEQRHRSSLSEPGAKRVSGAAVAATPLPSPQATAPNFEAE